MSIWGVRGQHTEEGGRRRSGTSQCSEGCRLPPFCLWEAILHACNYTSLIDNAEKRHWFGVSWRSAAMRPLITFQFCNVRFGFCSRICGAGMELMPSHLSAPPFLNWLEWENYCSIVFWSGSNTGLLCKIQLRNPFQCQNVLYLKPIINQ